MAKVKLDYKINESYCFKVDERKTKALKATAKALKEDIKNKEVMPYDTGNLQDKSTHFRKISNVKYELYSNPKDPLTGESYAPKIYEWDSNIFHKDKNKNAQGQWLHPWIYGEYKNFIKETYAKKLKELMKK